MQALLLKPDEHFRAWLEERRRNELDHRDEVWNGVLHVVPQPSYAHQSFAGALQRVLHPRVTSAGLDIAHEVAVFDRLGSATNFRVPDVAITDPRFISARGVEARAEIVIEVLSPDDESRKKFDFYAGCGIPELWIVHPVTRAIEVHVLRHGAYIEQPVASDGTIEAPRLGLTLRVVDGPKLRIGWADGQAEI